MVAAAAAAIAVAIAAAAAAAGEVELKPVTSSIFRLVNSTDGLPNMLNSPLSWSIIRHRRSQLKERKERKEERKEGRKNGKKNHVTKLNRG